MPEKEDPRVVRSRAHVLEAARQVFLADGYQAATVDHIAEVAGVAKRTIYNLYRDKDSLFRATILSAIEIADAFTASLETDLRQLDDPASELPAIAARLAESTLLGPAVPLRRLVIMESARFPELAAEYRTRAPEKVLGALATLFASMSKAGTLVVADEHVAAEHFAYLVMGADLDRGTFSGSHPTRERVSKRAHAGVHAFLSAYSPSA
ncbi:TetR/AcrR family transcriptional regulator [Glaciihabitans sp. INWT7]|uniref:TetR/AcrR family transcriptional regulator n=1 Tax=Glaciihabitans sp. INWT7 TaxID=2596912 RepID=UPI0016259B14|nr:TetR/AcrR family transcriptional regulator [Glaciihabitans sp. INWT7]QNE46393.1 TetR/AcrR family transcriptional regulator [Glaciihabitans sp. INWT7]